MYLYMGGIMLQITKNLKRCLSVLMAITLVMCLPIMTKADDLQDETDLFAGATAVMKGLAEEEPDWNVGAGFVLNADQEDIIEEIPEGEIAVLDASELFEEDAKVAEETNIVMANVKDAVNVRKEPSEDAEVAGKLYKNCGGEIIERRDGWTHLKSGELEGWTKDEYLFFGDEAAALREEVGKLVATITTDALRVRKEADEEAGVYTLLKSGDTIDVVEETEGWVAVQVDKDTVGYVSADYAEVEFKVESGKTTKQLEKEAAEKEKKKLSKNRGAVDVATSDVALLAALIQCEAGRESYEGKLAVGAVVMNRVRSKGFPGSINGVITAPAQFPPATNGKVAAVLAKGPSSSCMEAAQAAINGSSNVGGATHFRAASSGTQGIVIGNHVFW